MQETLPDPAAAVPSAPAAAHIAAGRILARHDELEQIVAGQSRFAKLIEVHPEIVGDLLFLRFAFTTGDASGHNMVTQAADKLLPAMRAEFTAGQP